ncbi:hypothetical protein C0V70_11490 [Bacteriovorax stolpii]|uniref:Uncharacterized protein n=1 Tax=Bacteriovorax stolpii TaxID=960 RepID=A0A2K9NVC1_BACTC|nr:hypothetical protein [Bacteriovorax stolpii]AUN98714.1 hypothetical protein C0V70_11490 [Bacteriovorax stolpii]TDP55776.1 hypothetical protein C8D79_0833 [Bacteriovorax stolpii]
MKLKAFVFVLLLALFNSLPTSVHAEDCMKIIKSMLPKMDAQVAKTIDLDSHLNHRNFIAQFAKKNKIPVFFKQNDQGVDVPVILLNAQSGPKLQAYLENSFGTQVALQKDWNNDHGLLRAGNYIIDLDTPGARGFGEIEETGLAWKNLQTYLTRRTIGSSPTLEVSYLLTPNEKSVIDYYQKVRRAALFRVKFTFGGHDGPDYPNLLKGGGEHCFIFCKAQSVYSHVSEIKTRLSALGIKNPDKTLEDAKIQKAIAQVQTLINETDPTDLHSEMLADKKTLALFSSIYPKELKNDQKKLEMINWLVSYDSSKRYGEVLDGLGVTGDYGIDDAINKRASAIFVYDEGADPAAFNNANYSNFGKFVSWPATKQYPVD